MSEEMTPEMIVDQLKSAVDEKVSTKAEAADLEAVKSAVEAMEIPSVEGFVKSEEVAELKEALAAQKAAHEELEATFKAAPAITKGAESMDYGIKWEGTESKQNAVIDLEPMMNDSMLKGFTKAYNNTTDVPNAPTGAAMVYWEGVQANPYRAVSTNMPLATGTLYLPSVTGITAQHEASIPSSIDTSSGHGGSLASERQLTLQNWTSRTAFSDASARDLGPQGLDMVIGQFQGNRIGQAEAIDMVSNMDGNSDITEVNTGVAAGLPTSIDAWADLVAALSSFYKPSASFSMSREAYANLRSLTSASTGGALVYDAGLASVTLFGFPIIINDHLDAGNAASQNPVYFGDHRQGLIIGTEKEMTLSRHMDTIPGARYYYANMRSRGTVWNPDALVRFNVAA